MEIVEKKLSELTPYANNPRKNDTAVDKVAESIKAFGFNVPIVIDKKGEIVAGHTRYFAAQTLGLEKVPCVETDLPAQKAREYRVIDNKTGELSRWDYGKLWGEMDAIEEIDMGAFGFPDREATEEAEPSEIVGGKEIDLGSFDDERLPNECPYCGFRW